jgi:hypothetical protein
VPNHLTVTIYNSAGEVVLVLFDGSAQLLPTELDLGASAIVNTDPAGLGILLPGALTQGGVTSYNGLTWLLDNSNGQKIGGGVYYIKTEYRDPFGAITSYVKGVQVLEDSTGDSVRIYNSAGERVWAQDLTVSAAALNIPGMGSYATEFSASGVGSPLGLSITDKNGNIVPLSFDGRGEQGQPLDGGTYVVQVEHRGPDGDHTILAKSIVLLGTSSLHPLETAMLGPNPARADDVPTLRYAAAPGRSCNVDVYNLSGELIAHGEDPAQSGNVFLSVQGRASGVFVVRVRLYQNGMQIDQRVMKLALVH